MSILINTSKQSAAPGQQQDKQRMFELAAGQHWTPFLEEVNDLMLEEKVSRHENDGVKTSEICLRIVSAPRPP